VLESLDKNRLAELCGKALFSHDRASAALGIKIVEVTPGHATASMEIRQDMVNGFDICHGGLIFSLADSAFALACNSHNTVSYAMGCHIEYLRPALKGDNLIARATEMDRTRNTGSYVVSVTNQDDKTIAVFHGRSSNRGQPLITHADLEKLEQDND
jgi:acyl-CoA thioesterase